MIIAADDVLSREVSLTFRLVFSDNCSADIWSTSRFTAAKNKQQCAFKGSVVRVGKMAANDSKAPLRYVKRVQFGILSPDEIVSKTML